MTRVPRLAIVAWGVAAAALAGLGVAVGHYLGSGGHDMHAMHAADALARGGAGAPSTGLTAGRLFTTWHLDALALAFVVLLAAVYLTGVALVPVRHPGQRWPVRRTAAFLGGLAVIGYATNGAIAVYDQVLFTAHMAGHLALVMVAPALLVGGCPLTLALLAAPPARRERLYRRARGRVLAVLTSPPVALAAYTVVIVGSHLTGVMDTIMRNTWAGQLEHLVYLLAGWLFFVLIVGAEPIRWRLGAPARFLLLIIAMAVDTFTGIVLIQGTRRRAAHALGPARQRPVRDRTRRRHHVGRRRRHHDCDHDRASPSAGSGRSSRRRPTGAGSSRPAAPRSRCTPAADARRAGPRTPTSTATSRPARPTTTGWLGSTAGEAGGLLHAEGERRLEVVA